MSGPIKPKEVQGKKDTSIPQEVFDAFNEMIVEKWNGSSANFTQDAVMNLVMTKLHASEQYKDVTRQQVYDRHWMDVEPAFRKVGWKVEYDKPGYNESYSANFTFEKK